MCRGGGGTLLSAHSVVRLCYGTHNRALHVDTFNIQLYEIAVRREPVFFSAEAHSPVVCRERAILLLRMALCESVRQTRVFQVQDMAVQGDSPGAFSQRIPSARSRGCVVHTLKNIRISGRKKCHTTHTSLCTAAVELTRRQLQPSNQGREIEHGHLRVSYVRGARCVTQQAFRGWVECVRGVRLCLREYDLLSYVCSVYQTAT